MSTIGYIVGALILGALVLYAIYFAYRILADANTLAGLMRIGIELGALLLVWMLLFGKGKGSR